MTGFNRDGYCRVTSGDFGVHAVCAQVAWQSHSLHSSFLQPVTPNNGLNGGVEYKIMGQIPHKIAWTSKAYLSTLLISDILV